MEEKEKMNKKNDNILSVSVSDKEVMRFHRLTKHFVHWLNSDDNCKNCKRLEKIIQLMDEMDKEDRKEKE